ncbi:MAG: hypothetical protein ACRERU_19005 [Methylococcales bacterium]
MSGNKYTEVQFKREQEEKLKLLQSLQGLRAECMELRKQLDEKVNDMSDGLRATFNTEVAASRQWLSKKETTPPDTYSMGHSLDGLHHAQRRQEQINSDGRTCLKKFQLALTEKAGAIGRAIAEQQVTVNQTLLQNSEVLQLWYGQEAVAAWKSRLEQADQSAHTEHYPEAEAQLSALHSEVQAKVTQATEQETQHQRRLYLLTALRQVTADLHFTEITEPNFEKPGERGSRIVFSVDTHDRGRIDFHLTMEGLGSFSAMGDNQCPVEFGTLSKQLNDQYGIQTRFRPATGEPAPELRRKGEKELPDDGAQRTTGADAGN